MFEDRGGPIERFDWGVFTVNGRRHGGGEGVGRDIRLIGDEISEWKERKGHVLTPDMIAGVFEHQPETLIIGCGVYGALECPDDVLADIRAHGIDDVRVLRTPDACKEYNALYHSGRRVALLAHGTC